MNAPIRRINPRRPFTVTAAGIRRIVLGESAAGAQAFHFPSPGGVHAAPAAAKPLRTAQASAKRLLVVAHSERGTLGEHARQAVAAAALIASEDAAVALLVFGELNDDIGALGADEAIVLDGPASTRYAPDRALLQLCALIDAWQPRHVFLPDHPVADGDLGRRLAAALGVSVATQVVEIDRDGVAVYWDQGKTLARRALPKVILLAAEVADPRLPFVGRGERLPPPPALAAVDDDVSVFEDLGVETIAASQVALEEADFIVSAGNGVTDVPAFEQLAGAFGAATGASRVAVDDGKFTRDKQIGATGKTVSASAYIAIGISGAVQHLQGIKDCRHVIAVNQDASAPMIKRADLSVIDDAQAFMQALLEEIAAQRAAPAGETSQTRAVPSRKEARYG